MEHAGKLWTTLEHPGRRWKYWKDLRGFIFQIMITWCKINVSWSFFGGPGYWWSRCAV